MDLGKVRAFAAARLRPTDSVQPSEGRAKEMMDRKSALEAIQ